MRNKNWLNAYKSVMKKEFLEVAHTMKVILLLSVLVPNLLQYITMQEVLKLELDNYNTGLYFGTISVYLVTIVILFTGHTLISRFMYDERKGGTLDILLAAGLDKTAIWAGKMTVVAVVCEVMILLAQLINAVFSYFYFGVLIRFTAVAGILTFVAMPLLCYGILALISIAYWYFKDMSLFGIAFPILSYIGIWNISLKLVELTFPGYMVAVSLGLAILFIGFTVFTVQRIKRERMIIR